MAKDYFQDIVPPRLDGNTKRQRGAAAPVPHKAPAVLSIKKAPEAKEPFVPDEEEVEVEEKDAPMEEASQPARSIRNINMPQRPRERMRPAEIFENPRPSMQSLQRKTSSRKWIWIIALISILVVGGLALFVFRPTSVTIIPHSHVVTFDQTSQFVAYPQASAPPSTLAYILASTDLEDSQVVTSAGTVQAQDKASGSITVYNNYSTDVVRLIKNTRFQSPDGLIFRIPEDVVVPGKSASSPGHVDVTVIADQAGQQYNIASTQFTLPGLKSSDAEYKGVYAQSSAAMTGGFVGAKPSISAGDQQTAVSAMRERMQSKIHDIVSSYNTSTTTAFFNLSQSSYQDMPATDEGGGKVRLHEVAHVRTPLFPTNLFASTIASSIAADAENTSIDLRPAKDFAATYTSATSTVLGTDPINFSLSGSATLVWKVDSAALAKALAGRDEGAFQTIISGFTSIQEAHARVEPFWKRTFPDNPESIKIQVTEPVASQ